MKIDIRQLRLDIGATQLQFAKMAGVTRAALVEWEAGTMMPSGDRLNRISFLFRNKERIYCKTPKPIKKMQLQDIPLEVIERWLKDSDFDVRYVAMNACQGKDIPLEVIERGLKDSDWRVRQAAMNALREKNLPVLPIRLYEPPRKVYKKCLSGVILEVEIPSYAHINGQFGQKCRTSHAIITDVKGDLHGLKVGISLYDKTTVYSVGDVVHVDNYCLSEKECAAGFHYFNTLEEAEKFEM